MASFATGAPGCSVAGVHRYTMALRSLLRRAIAMPGAMAAPGSGAAEMAWLDACQFFEQIEQSLNFTTPACALRASTAVLDVFSRANVLPRLTAPLDKELRAGRLNGGRPIGDRELPRVLLAAVVAAGRALAMSLSMAEGDGVPEHAARWAVLRQVESLREDPGATTAALLRRHAVTLAEVFEGVWDA